MVARRVIQRSSISGCRVAALAAALLLGAGSLHAQPAAADTTVPVLDPTAFRVYDSAGSAITLDAVIDRAMDAAVLMIGETHDDPTAHALELELLRRMNERAQARRDLVTIVLSMEMFERDAQPVLSEYLAGIITEPQMLAAARPWPRYRTDYRPSVEYARQNNIPVIAANAPRRYVNRASRLGRGSLDTLSATAKGWLAPLPYPQPTAEYRARFLETMGGMHGEGPSADSLLGRMLDAQSLWDATMAWSISEALRAEPTARVVHMVGAFHIERWGGTVAQLQGYRPGVKVFTVVIRPDTSLAPMAQELRSLGDAVIVTDAARVPSRKQE